MRLSSPIILAPLLGMTLPPDSRTSAVMASGPTDVGKVTTNHNDPAASQLMDQFSTDVSKRMIVSFIMPTLLEISLSARLRR